MGANLPGQGGSSADTVTQAVSALAKVSCGDFRASGLYLTPCFPAGSGPDFVNAAVSLHLPADRDVVSILAELHRIEADFGRRRLTRWGSRTLDLDLIALGDSVSPDAETQTRWRLLPPADQARLAPDVPVVPHPRMQDRAFVLVPLAEVAPDWRHPLLGRTVAEMLAALPEADRAAVVRLPDRGTGTPGLSRGESRST